MRGCECERVSECASGRMWSGEVDQGGAFEGMDGGKAGSRDGRWRQRIHGPFLDPASLEVGGISLWFDECFRNGISI